MSLSIFTGSVHTCDYEAHHALAKRAAAEGAVLLKNEGGLLPLAEGARIAVIGDMARQMRYLGSGSSHINPMRFSQPLDFLPGAIYAPGCDERGDTSAELLAEAAVVFAGLPERCESEGFDRDSLRMSEGHLRMIEAVAAANPNTAVVLLCGSAVECLWADRVRAILCMGLPGEAAADLLYGRANPGGRLAESWPYRYEDVPSSKIYDRTADALYEEGLYVGYCYYDKSGTAVRWPFGYGLSYTSFSYSEPTLSGRRVSVTVENTGARAGTEVVQLYVSPPEGGLHRPVQELKGFQKVFLQPGESREVAFDLTERSFAVWQGGWRVPGGRYTLEIGGKRLCLDMDGEALLGRGYVPPVLKKDSFTMDNTVAEMRPHSLIMKIMYKATECVIAGGCGGKVDYENPQFRMYMASSVESPLRSMQISSGMNGGLFPGLLEMANGHFLRGLARMIRG